MQSAEGTPGKRPDPDELPGEPALWLHQAAFVGRLAALPYATIALLVVFALLHFWVLGLADGSEKRAVFFLLVGGAKVDSLVAQGEWWRLLASVFLHSTFSHLLVNSLGVLLLGWFLENGAGRGPLLTTFVVAGFGGSLVSFFVNQTPSVGASGGMFGLLGATIVFALFRWQSIPRLVRAYVVGLPAVVGVFNIGYGFYVGHVDNWAHIGGAVFGMLSGVFCHLALQHEESLPRRMGLNLGRAVVVLATAYSLGAAVMHLQMRFDLPETPLGTAVSESGVGYHYPERWNRGAFREGQCFAGESWGDGPIRCYVDSFSTWFLVGPPAALVNTPMYMEFHRRQQGEAPDMYADDTILWGSDPRRGLDFALLAFDEISPKYLPLFAALQAPPASELNQ